MSYTKTNWENKPSKKTPIKAENLNHMEEGIAEVYEKLDNLPQWSKQEEKPKYTYDEVGADEQGTAEKLVDSHNESETSHDDIRGNLANLEIYKANSITSECSNDYIHVTDSANVKLLNMGLQGKTEQKTYQGKNLFNYKSDKWSTDFDETKKDHATITFVDDGFRITNNVVESNKWINVFYEVDVKPNTSYKLKGLHNHNYPIKVVDDSNNTILNDTICDGVTTGSFVSPSDGKIYINFSTTRGNIEANDSTYTQVMLSVDNSVYEPYVGGIPSPNPQYPQEIVNAGVLNEDTGKYEIECKVANKNLFDESKLSGGEFVEFNGVRCYKYFDNDKNFLYDGNFKENTQYSITVRIFRDNTELSKDKDSYIKVIYTDGTFYNIIANPNKVYTYVSDKGKSISRISGSYNYNYNTYLDLSVMQIEEGAEATEYEPPKQQHITLTSDRPITKWDKLVKRDGVWGWSIYQLHLTLYGNKNSDDWDIYNNETYFGFFVRALPENMERRVGYANQLRINAKGMPVENAIWLGVNNDYIYAICNVYYDDSLEDKGLSNWKEHLDDNPLEIWTYSEEEQEFIPLSDEEQALLNNLETYYGVTNVYNDQGCPMRIEYVADTKKYIEQNYTPKSEIEEIKNQLAELQTLVVNNV